MIRLFFLWHLIFYTVFTKSDTVQVRVSNPVQDFESEFSIASYPSEFLTGWYANEIRSSSSRIYQGASLGRIESKALVVQPISTFNGEIFVALSPKEFDLPSVKFWAKSVKNGSGNRSAEVFYSWSNKLDGEYSGRKILGSIEEFENEDQEFSLFELPLPYEIVHGDSVFLQFEIIYGAGSGTCAKWVMDDFEFGDFLVDDDPPGVVSVRGFDSDVVEVRFDEAMDAVFSEFVINYRLDDQEPSEIRREADSLVYLSFQEKLLIGNTYELGIKQIPDLEGNFLQDTLISFQFFDPTVIPAKSLVINEIMPAPKEGLELPNSEYVEIYYAGETAIRLKGITWSNSKTTVALEDKWVLPGEFFLLIPEKQALLFKDYEQVVALKNWPTLLNSGDKLTIRDSGGDVIDRISYATASWGGSEFSNGGYSLEVSNPFYPCDQTDLLRSSIDSSRGTPAKQNSTYDLSPDTNQPTLNSFEIISPRSLMLRFSKPILSGFDQSNFIINPESTVDSLAQVSSTQIQFFFSKPLKKNTKYSLEIKGLVDCSGNNYLQAAPLEFVLPIQAINGDVLINELLFNPKTGSPKFVEIINLTENYLEVRHWKLANLDDVKEIDQVKQLSEFSVIIKPKGFLAITTNADQLGVDFPNSGFGDFHEIKTIPSFPVSGGTVILLDSAGAIADEFNYSEDLHHPLLRDSKGVSLERLSLDSPASLSANWHSASATQEYGTPGRKNSQVISGEFEGKFIQIEPEVFDPEGSNGNTFTSISYELDQPGWIGSFRIYSTTGQLIHVLTQNELLGARGLFSWTGTDSQGKVVRPGYYILSVELYDLSGQVKVIRKTIVIATKL